MLGFALITAGLMFSQVVVADGGYGAESINKIDKAKKIIDFGEYKFKYDKNIVIYDLHGKRVDFDLLEEGMSAKIGYDKTQRFVGYPTLRSLHLKSVIEY